MPIQCSGHSRNRKSEDEYRNIIIKISKKSMNRWKFKCCGNLEILEAKPVLKKISKIALYYDKL